MMVHFTTQVEVADLQIMMDIIIKVEAVGLQIMVDIIIKVKVVVEAEVGDTVVSLYSMLPYYLEIKEKVKIEFIFCFIKKSHCGSNLQ
uniref:Putative ovule protein n=1 Tax=Solanum chacoense TaxID=4108 RepID=A0A0V0HFZ8_SOLCH